MVVAGHRSKFDAGVNHEVHQSRLHLGLAGFEVIATNEGAMLFCQFNGSRYECILWRAIDEWCVLEDTSDSKDGRGSHFRVSGLDSLHQVVGSIVYALDDIGIAFGVGSPLDNDLVQGMGFLEFATMMSVEKSGSID